MHTAVAEVTLVLFTTLGPAGAFACTLTAIALLVGKLPGDLRENLCHMMGLPLVVATVGLVASSTHLGTPSNALYVLTGVGRSPLSNEVVCAILFLAVTGAFWLYSFSTNPRVALLRAGEAAVAALGLLCVGGISLAYDQGTIVTWATWHTPAIIWPGGLGAGVPLFLLTVRLAHAWDALGQGRMMSIVVGAASCVACTVCAALQHVAVAGMRNEFLSVSELAPHDVAFVATYAALSAVAYAICFRSVRASAASIGHGGGETSSPAASGSGGERSSSAASGSGGEALIASAPARRPADRNSSRATGRGVPLASAFALLALFVLRFAFYAIHMTVGISL